MTSAAWAAALSALNDGRALEALRVLESLRSARFVEPRLDYCYALALAQLGRVERAVTVLRERVAREPSDPEVALLRELEAAVGSQVRGDCSSEIFGPSLNPTTLARIAADAETWQEILSFHGALGNDEYVQAVDAFYRQACRRFGAHWHYLDITNVLYAASKALKPGSYLEVGVRRGRSACVVARGCPTVDIVGCDMWMANYAGMENPGPEFVRGQLQANGHRGKVEFLDGDSHVLLPRFFDAFPQRRFDLITVDGDHSEAGAYADLRAVVPHLTVGGVVVFDDIVHPGHRYLLGVWRRIVEEFDFLRSFEYSEQGYGIGFAVRMEE